MSRFGIGRAEKEKDPNRRRLRLPRKTLAIVGILSVAASFAYKSLDSSGKVDRYPQTLSTASAPDHTKLRVMNWNVHNQANSRANQIKKLIASHELDVVMLQEVNRDAARKFAKKFPGMDKSFVLADSRVKPTRGGLGNLVMTQYEQKDTDSISLSGTSLLESTARTIAGLGQDAAHAGEKDGKIMPHTRNAYQEDRAALAVTIEVPLNNQGQKQEVSLATAHLGYQDYVRDSQMDKLINFLPQSDDNPVIFCGDLNSEPEEVSVKFAAQGFTAPLTTPTLTGREKATLDHCAYNNAAGLEMNSIKVLPEPHTDHRPIIAEFDINATPQD